MSDDGRGVNHRDASPVPWPPAEPVSELPRGRNGWVLVMTTVGTLVGISLARSSALRIDAAEVIAVAFLLLPAVWINILLHEAGHALAGLACRMQPIAFGIGPFRLERGLSGWYWRHGGAIRGIGGFAILVPSQARGLRRFDAACFSLGGPVANLLVAAIAFAMLRSHAMPSMSRAWWVAMAMCGTVLGVLNLVPLTVQGWRNDGRQLIDLLLGRADALAALRMQAVAALGQSGVRPREWPATLMPLSMPECGTLRINALLLQMIWATDRGDPEQLARTAPLLADAFWSAPPAMRAHIALALAGYAIRSGDADAANAWRPLCEGGMLHTDAFRGWLDAALALHAGDIGQTRVQIAFARMEATKVHSAADAMILGELLDDLQERIDRVQPAT